jgi:hypothetical protein
MNIHDKINLRGLVSDFPKIGEKEFGNRFRKLKIGDTGELENTLRIMGKLSGSSVIMELTYRYYGDFSHLGVGKGVTQADVGVQRMVGGGRKKKPWKKGIGHMRYRLGELYQEQLGDGLESFVKDSMDKKISFKM